MLQKHIRRFIFFILIVASSSTFAEDVNDLKFIDGTWQFVGLIPFDLGVKEDGKKFYSLHYEGSALVLVDFELMKFCIHVAGLTFNR